MGVYGVPSVRCREGAAEVAAPETAASAGAAVGSTHSLQSAGSHMSLVGWLLRVSARGSGSNAAMEPRFVLALDQGTTSSRALIFDQNAAIVGRGQQEFPQIYPEPGLVEHDAHAIWASETAAMEQAMASAGAKPSDIAAVGITNQRETTLVWNRETGEPIHNAIVWQDRRTAAMCDELRARGVEPMITEKTGLRIDPYFSATKLRWLLDHVEGAQNDAHDSCSSRS